MRARNTWLAAPSRLALRQARLVLALLCAGPIAACSGGPGTLGITGPDPTGKTPQTSFGAVNPPGGLLPDDSVVLPPGTPVDQGARFAPSVVPSYGSNGQYYGDD